MRKILLVKCRTTTVVNLLAYRENLFAF